MREILVIYGGLLSLMLKFLQCLMKPAFSGAQSSLGGREAGGRWRAQQVAFLSQVSQGCLFSLR